MQLTAKQIAEFENNGVLIVSIFDPDDLRPLKDEISSFIDQHAHHALHEGKISTLYEEKDFAHPVAGECLEGEAVIMRQFTRIPPPPTIAANADGQWIYGTKRRVLRQHGPGCPNSWLLQNPTRTKCSRITKPGVTSGKTRHPGRHI